MMAEHSSEESSCTFDAYLRLELRPGLLCTPEGLPSRAAVFLPHPIKRGQRSVSDVSPVNPIDPSCKLGEKERGTLTVHAIQSTTTSSS